MIEVVFNFPYVVLNGGDMYHMDHMMDWWGIPNMGYWWMAVWVVQLILAILVYRDTEKQEKSGLIWFILIIIPWVGILFLIGYLVVRGEEAQSEEVIEEALKLLDERYAKGEISRKEYLQMKNDIKKD